MKRGGDVGASIVVFAIVALIALLAMQVFREAGGQPFFYQSNFEPAVMRACGRGFGVGAGTPAELTAFLLVQRQDFDCARLPPSLRIEPIASAANANWYYLYHAVAMVWMVTGPSWPALDYLVSLLAGGTAVALYGLFRLISGTAFAVVMSLLLALSPASLRQLPSLRDYSKAPFALAAIFIIGLLLSRAHSRARTWGLAAAYGAVVGLGYGFRSDLIVMVPLGIAMCVLWLPGPMREKWPRNLAAGGVMLLSFLLVAAPVLRSLDKGGCHYHFALLGLTGTASAELHLREPSYRFGHQALDIFGNVKVGDYANRVLHAPPPALCDAEYDQASGALFQDMIRTFPADMLVRGYASVLMILRMGFEVPEIKPVSARAPRWIEWPFDLLRELSALTPVGVVISIAALAVAFSHSLRVGLALSAMMLFLAGYPAIRFEERHWFHLRFIPWWCAAFMIAEARRRRGIGWPRVEVIRGAAGASAVIGLMVVTLIGMRAWQTRNVHALVDAYHAASTDALAIAYATSSRVSVAWQPDDYGVAPEHRGSDMLVVTLDSRACAAGTGALSVMVKYETGAGGAHELSTPFHLTRPAPGAAPTMLFAPVFWAGYGGETLLRFAGLEVAGAAAACIQRVARVRDRGGLPLWMEVQAAPDWKRERLFQTIEPPPAFASVIKRPL